MGEFKQEGPFRDDSEQRATPKAAPDVGNAVQIPVKECTVTIRYKAERPDVPSIVAGSSDQCAAGAEIALAVALSTLLKGWFALPIR